MATLAAQKAASNLGTQLDAALRTTAQPSSSSPAEVVQSPEAVSATASEPATTNETVFRKPSWPASAARSQTSAKPVLPPRQAQTVPIINQPTPPADSWSAPAPGTNAAGAAVPRVRAPSPGLLKRMSSMETSVINASMNASTNTNANTNPSVSSTSSAPTLGTDGAADRRLEPKKLNLKKQSVEDLRRLYEERNNVAEGLGRAEASRRRSAAS
ncbi:MAG: hypothetical protein INR62_11820 [Rhodospirillales bacterium]|nr:hypothetical protein [Acetobacter sp.]